MKKWIITLMVVLSTTFGASSAKAEGVLTSFNDYLADNNIELSVSADLALYDKYIWRGFRLDGDKSIQPGLTFGIGPFEGGYWGSWDLQNDDSLASDESDGWLGVSFDLGFLDESLEIVGVSAGHTWYAFPEADLYSQEFYLGFSIDTFLSPSFTWYHDYEDEAQGGADGDYYIIGLGHSFTLVEEYGITLDLGEEIGFNSDAFITGDGGWSTTTVGFTIPLTDNVSMSPSFAFTSPWGDLDSGGGNDQDDEFWGGIAFSFSG